MTRVAALGFWIALLVPPGVQADAPLKPEGAFGARVILLDKPLPVPDYTFEERRADGTRREWGMIEFRGRVVVLNFWATWCRICERELPKFDRLAAALADDKIDMLALSLDEEIEETATTLASRGHRNLRVLRDPDSVLSTLMGVSGVPTTFVVGPDGRALAAVEGPADWHSKEALAWLRSLAGSATSRAPEAPVKTH